MTRWIPVVVAVLAALHLSAVLDHWAVAKRSGYGADFASYYYAVVVARDGGDPYDTPSLAAAARDEHTRRAVHPFFYPPPFLLFLAWAPLLSLKEAYHLWFWLDEAFAVAVGLLLWRWWRALGPAVPVLIAAAIATLTAVPNNHVMGQVNLPVLALVIGGLWADDEDRAVLGGVLVGTACMLKMSPALFVLWWLLRRRWVAAAVACATGAALSLLALPLVPLTTQARFYVEVLPGFATGDYNGLLVPIDLFGNHSLPDLYHRWFPGPTELLSSTARALSSATTLALLGGLGWAFRGPADAQARAAQVGAVGVVTLLVPVYTYEHHLVFALPAVVAVGAAVASGALSRRWAVALGLAWLVWAWDLAWLKGRWRDLGEAGPLALVVREAKFGALLLLLVSCVRVGWRGRIAAPEAPP